jgi:DNA-binding NarL/FixJ family response regulator
MKILVIDDLFSTNLQVAHAVQEWQDCLLKWVQYPENLESALTGGTFDLAFVDLHYGRRRATGLTAQHVISDSSPSTRTVVYSNEQEDNRVLLLLASYHYFDPFAVLSKSASNEEIRAVVGAARGGRRAPAFAAGGAYGEAALLIGELLKRESDLRIWRALTQYSERSAIGGKSGLSASAVSRFADEKFPVVEDVRSRFLGLEHEAVHAMVQQDRKNDKDQRFPRLAPLHAFAVIQAEFFHDRELDKLVAGPREMEPTGDAPRRRRLGRRRGR